MAHHSTLSVSTCYKFISSTYRHRNINAVDQPADKAFNERSVGEPLLLLYQKAFWVRKFTQNSNFCRDLRP